MYCLRKHLAAVVLLASLAFARPALCDLTVGFGTLPSTFAVGDMFTVDILADIPNPVVGWGLDLAFDPTKLTLTAPPTIGSAWSPAFAPDSDGLAALAFPASISGLAVPLASLSFTVAALGDFGLGLSTTPGDLTEGFALDPSGFALTTFLPPPPPGPSGVVPVPSAFLLAAFGLGTVGWIKRRVG